MGTEWHEKSRSHLFKSLDDENRMRRAGFMLFPLHKWLSEAAKAMQKQT